MSAVNDQGQTRLLGLYFTVDDLYLRGFTDNSLQAWQFNDSDFNLLSQLDNQGATPDGGGSTLPFGSNYNSLRQAAGRGRESLPISYTAIRDAIFGLSGFNGSGTQNAARNLMLMIQFTSEAIRFNDVFGVMNDVTSNAGHLYPGLPLFQQYLENDWTSISNYGFALSSDPSTPPLTLQGINPSQGNATTGPGVPFTLTSFNDVVRFLAVMAGNVNNANDGGVSGNWNHDEL